MSYEPDELNIPDKFAYLVENYPFGEIPAMDDKRFCLHCGKIIRVGDYKIYKGSSGMEFICCPNAPECNGTVIDWMPEDMDFS
ncbi:MAG: hypothetical protein KA941_04735 [Flavobacteriales bacterium]|nr:hypothetical protein [Flavobacteriales bacterium]